MHPMSPEAAPSRNPPPAPVRRADSARGVARRHVGRLPARSARAA